MWVNKAYDEHMNLIVQLAENGVQVDDKEGTRVGYEISKPVVFVRGDSVVTVSKED